MKRYIELFAAGIVAAQQSERVTIEQAVDANTRSEGWFEEVMATEGTKQEITLKIGWETSGNGQWKTGYWVQNYVEWADPLIPGNLIAMTCNTQYDRDADHAKITIVRNLYGSESIKVSDVPSGKWNSYGKPASPALHLFTKDESDSLAYKSTYEPIILENESFL